MIAPASLSKAPYYNSSNLSKLHFLLDIPPIKDVFKIFPRLLKFYAFSSKIGNFNTLRVELISCSIII